MKRKIYQDLVDWKHRSAGTTALLIDGARRVGKSYIAEAFAKAEYRSFIIIDFNREGDELRDLFRYQLNDLDSFFSYLSAYFNTQLFPGESLIIFDEVQLFPRARAAIKYLVADGRYHYLETGSLMSIKKNAKDIVIPSEEEHLRLYPMDFEEYLWAKGNETLMPFIREHYENRAPMGQTMHRKAMQLLREYLIVGGMPQAVDCYLQTNDFEAVDHIKRTILRLYREDISVHAENYSLKVESVFDEIPSQLQKHDKKFRLASLGSDARTRNYEDAFLWLDDAMVANMCFNATEPSVGLRLNRDRMTMKIYMMDTGLLFSHAFDENTITSEVLYRKVLFDKLSFNGGMLMENLVAQMLRTAGHQLYFFSSYSKANKEDRMEIDFLIAKPNVTNRHNIIPIEVKSGKNYTYTSLIKFRNKYQQEIDTPVILHTSDLREENGYLYLPLYMTPLL